MLVGKYLGPLLRKVTSRRYTDKENAVLGYLQGLVSDYPGRILGNAGDVNDDSIKSQTKKGPYNGTAFEVFQQAFPDCKLSGWMFENQYHLRRIFYRQGRVKSVHFIASPDEHHTANINSHQAFTKYISKTTWFAHSTCRDGKIENVQTAGPTRTGTGASAARCGFGSVVLFFCFLNKEHLPTNQGYPINSDRNFEVGNMPAIANGLIRDSCSQIIYVKYFEGLRLTSGLEADPEKRGSKAFIYAALAAGYDRMVTYNPDPCRTGCCSYRKKQLEGMGPNEHPDESLKATDNPHGKAFDLTKILTPFQKHGLQSLNPDATINEPSFQETKEFSKHHGEHWYFCSEGPPSPFKLGFEGFES